MLNKIKNQYNSMTGSQKRICQYILENYSIVATLSAADFAAEVGVSDATIVRFAQEIGFSGFTEMKAHLRNIMKGPAAPYEKFLAANDRTKKQDEILNMGKSDIKGLEELLLAYDETLMKVAVDAIYAARRIYFVALGSAATLQDFLLLHLRRMGFDVISLSESGAVNFEKMVTLQSQDLLVAICFPQYSLDTCKAINFAKKQQAQVLTITDNVDSVVGMNADIVLPVKMEHKIFFNSYVVPMALCNILLVEVFDRDSNKIEETIKRNMENLKNMK